jgi:hypothetical protein
MRQGMPLTKSDQQNERLSFMPDYLGMKVKRECCPSESCCIIVPVAMRHCCKFRLLFRAATDEQCSNLPKPTLGI